MTGGRSISCPSCGGTIEIKAAGYSVSVGCGYCGSLLDVASDDVKIIEKYEHETGSYTLSLGRRATLSGVEWEVIGALRRSDDEMEWAEYLLFNPYVGYRWLIESDDGWQLGTMLIDRPVEQGAAVLWRDRRYGLDYDPGQVTTEHVVGEFYWRVKAGDVVTATTYSRGNDMLSAEWNADEVNWTQLNDVDEDALFDAFSDQSAATGGQANLVSAGWIGSADNNLMQRLRNNYDEAEAARWDDLPKMFGLGFATLFMSLFLLMAFGAVTDKFSAPMTVEIDGATRNQTLGTLNVTRSYQIVSITAHGMDFENRWIDLDYSLVERTTQRTYTAYGVVERYSGRDSDGSWSEGSNSTTVKFSSVQQGQYDVIVDAAAHRWNATNSYSSYADQSADQRWQQAEQMEVNFVARAGGVAWSFLILEFVLLFGIPLIILWWRAEFV